MSLLDKTQYPDIFNTASFALIDPGTTDNQSLGVLPTDKDVYIDSVKIFTDADPAADLQVCLAYTEPALSALITDDSQLDVLSRVTENSPQMNGIGAGGFVEFSGRTSGLTGDVSRGSLACLDATPGEYVGDTIVLTSADGTTITYKYSTSGTSGDLNADGTVNIKAVTNANSTAAQVKIAIDSANGHGTGRFTVTVSNFIILIVNVQAGRSGNTLITSSEPSNTSIGGHFTGGVDAGEPNFIPCGSTLRLCATDGTFPSGVTTATVIVRYRERRG
tara:strand:- start:514 stop:1341 length:828 start_codon:yes stop_codon:yes gene_type:complete